MHDLIGDQKAQVGDCIMISDVNGSSIGVFRRHPLSGPQTQSSEFTALQEENADKEETKAAIPAALEPYRTRAYSSDMSAVLLKEQEVQDSDRSDLDGKQSEKAIASKYDLRNISPKQTANLSQELYDNGDISFKQHALLSFQAELNPDYNETIGAVSPRSGDEKRDLISYWNDQLSYQQRSGAPENVINNTKEITGLLDRLQGA
jgi:hypothetical protein